MSIRVGLDSSAMKSSSVWLCAIANIGNIFAITFLTTYLTFGQYMATEVCVYTTTTILLVAIFSLLILRKHRLSHRRLQTFLDPVRKGVIAHRGGAFEAPENTLLSFREAKKNGASSVEIDLEMTKDGVAVLLHDSTVDRTTDGTGEIKDMTFADIRKLNAAAKYEKGSHIHFEQIPTVEEAVLECMNLDMNIFFDIKNYSPEMINFLEGLFKKYPHLYDTSMVCSFFPQVLFQLRRKDDQILTALTAEPDFLTQRYRKANGELSFFASQILSVLDLSLVWSIYNWLWFFIGNSGVLLKHTTVSHDIIDYWAERGIAVITWTVNSEEGKQHFTEDLQVPVITDKIKSLNHS